jgi:hypothetical protein
LYRDRDKTLAHRNGKNCAIPACHRDSFLAHNRYIVPDGFAGNANSLNCRAVGFNDLLAAPMIPVKAILITFE